MMYSDSCPNSPLDPLQIVNTYLHYLPDAGPDGQADLAAQEVEAYYTAPVAEENQDSSITPRTADPMAMANYLLRVGEIDQATHAKIEAALGRLVSGQPTISLTYGNLEDIETVAVGIFHDLRNREVA